MSERRACGLIGLDRSTHRYRRRADRNVELRQRLRELAEQRRRFGYRRLHVLLCREGHAVNKKRVQRLYRQEGLSLRGRRPCAPSWKAVGLFRLRLRRRRECIRGMGVSSAAQTRT